MMTASGKFTWGLILNISGSLLVVGGIALSFTLIGACIGVPMAVVGLPLAIWGMVWIYQGRDQKQREAIAGGIREGLSRNPETPKATEAALAADGGTWSTQTPSPAPSAGADD
jgi:hypothetical protein